MKVSKEQAAENRERILNEAARLFRERGATGVGVDALAEAAGMTYGSLYSQFGSKDQVMAEALKHGHSLAAGREESIKGAAEAFTAYLSSNHRDNPGRGCFMAALGGDMPRQVESVRKNFTEIVKSNAERLSRLLFKDSGRDRKDDALAMMAAMVGAIVLARAVNDPAFSDRILTVSRERLLQQV